MCHPREKPSTYFNNGRDIAISRHQSQEFIRFYDFLDSGLIGFNLLTIDDSEVEAVMSNPEVLLAVFDVMDASQPPGDITAPHRSFVTSVFEESTMTS